MVVVPTYKLIVRPYSLWLWSNYTTMDDGSCWHRGHTSKIMIYRSYLVGGLEHFFIVHKIWDDPSHWLSCFSRWLKPPSRYIYNIQWLKSDNYCRMQPVEHDRSTAGTSQKHPNISAVRWWFIKGYTSQYIGIIIIPESEVILSND